MAKKYQIQWCGFPEKREALAAAYALTGDWEATTRIWAAQFPLDAQHFPAGTELRNRLHAQYGEAYKQVIG